MANFWAMKTFKEWWEGDFQNKVIVGIDEDGIDDNYLVLTKSNIDAVIDAGLCNEEIDRFFRNFCKYMEVGDYILIGSSKAVTFNVVGIARVKSDYYYDSTNEPRHCRDVEFLKKIEYPGYPIAKLKRTIRLEYISEQDFIETVAGLIEETP
jgi:hypothetical protein